MAEGMWLGPGGSASLSQQGTMKTALALTTTASTSPSCLLPYARQPLLRGGCTRSMRMRAARFSPQLG
jgi:hypothetical protein